MKQEYGKIGSFLLIVSFCFYFWGLRGYASEGAADFVQGSNTHEWQAVGPFPGNDVFYMTVNPQNSEELFAVADLGVYRSRDGGDSWQLVMSEINFTNRVGIAVDPHTSSNVYVVTRQLMVKSQDGGITWTVEPIAFSIDSATSIIIDPVTPSTFYLLTEEDGNFRSMDSGNTWQHISSSGNLLLNPQNPQQLFLSIPTGLYRSEDRGITWTQISPQAVRLLAVNPHNPIVIYAELSVSVNQDVLLKSNDGGTTWIPIYEGEEGFLINSLAIDTENAEILYFGTLISGTFRSLDGGTTWESINSNLPDILPTRRLIADPNIGGRIFLSYGLNGIYRSDNRGNEWDWKQVGLGGFNSRGIAVNPQQPSEVFVWHDWLYKSNDGAASWTQVPGVQLGGNRSFGQNPITPTILYAGTTHQGMLKSIDGGNSWQGINKGLPSGINTYISLVAVHPLTPNVVFAHYSLLTTTYATFDGGATWNPVPELNRYLRAIAFHPTNPAIIYAGTHQGLWRTTDGGTTWEQIGSLDEFIYTIAIDPTSPNTIYIGISNDDPIMKSVDGGVTWNPVNIGVVNARGHDIKISPLNPNVIYAAITGRGIFRSGDGGETWTTENIGLYNDVSGIGLDPQNAETLYASTDGLSVFRSRSPRSDLYLEPTELSVVHPLSNTIDSTLPIQLVNRGSRELTWSIFLDADIDCNGPSSVPWVVTGAGNGVVSPFSTVSIPITFTSTSLTTGIYSAFICIITNEPDAPLQSVPLFLSVGEGNTPQPWFIPNEFEVNLSPNSQVGRQLLLQNRGNAQLNWRVGLFDENICDAGATEEWLAWSVNGGSTMPGEQDRLGFAFNSGTLGKGTYSTTLCIRHNGSQNPLLLRLSLTISDLPLTPTPIRTATATPTVTATNSATQTPTPTSSATATNTPLPEPTYTQTPLSTVTVTASPALTHTPVRTSTVTGTSTPKPSVTQTPTVKPSTTITWTPTPISTTIPTPTIEPSQNDLFLPLVWR